MNGASALQVQSSAKQNWNFADMTRGEWTKPGRELGKPCVYRSTLSTTAVTSSCGALPLEKATFRAKTKSAESFADL
jgi:hypothetical protein